MRLDLRDTLTSAFKSDALPTDLDLSDFWIKTITLLPGTRQFHQLVAEKLFSEGIYAVNVMGHPLESRLVSSMTRTLKEDFKYVNHFTFMKETIQNIWILAGKQPIYMANRL